ncbi:carboxymuconolactone decarboxylase family protein [Caballeronia zhejiangensis]|uniref:carboxymuconolactone decarboxylase family protein n=1 Tax=Caballeronia zhejiangensis TaxID=871203 RepID=UPI001EF4F53B|nr:carboxymuconolactone decarboxylase family protein [Caballeronia zhejiangensis]MCG7400271.1 carboxymuconolactone decarboxylase family protein [Caballeronia zhejiangensis]
MTESIRVPLIEPGTRPELAEVEATIRAERGGEIAVLYQALLNSAPIASGWEGMLTAVRNRTLIPADLRELIILRVAVLNRASFEFEAHEPHARKAGVSVSKIAAVRTWPAEADGFSDDERLVLELTDCMTRDVVVPEAVMQRMCARFDPRGVVEIVATVAAYNMVSRFLVALNIIH